MKKISYWAKDHIWQSRILIIVIHLSLITIGIFVGKQLKEINVIISQPYFIVGIISTVLIWISYPDKNKKKYIEFADSYFRRKAAEFSLGLVIFLMIIYTGNNSKDLFKSEAVQASKIVRHTRDSVNYNNPLIKNFIDAIHAMDVSKLSQREKLRLIKKQIKMIRHDDEASKTGKELLIILSILIAIALLFGLAALSCNIACAGSGALAIIVALGGTFLIIFFLVKLIKRITRGPKKKSKIDAENIK